MSIALLGLSGITDSIAISAGLSVGTGDFARDEREARQNGQNAAYWQVAGQVEVPGAGEVAYIYKYKRK